MFICAFCSSSTLGSEALAGSLGMLIVVTARSLIQVSVKARRPGQRSTACYLLPGFRVGGPFSWTDTAASLYDQRWKEGGGGMNQGGWGESLSSEC